MTGLAKQLQVVFFAEHPFNTVVPSGKPYSRVNDRVDVVNENVLFAEPTLSVGGADVLFATSTLVNAPRDVGLLLDNLQGGPPS